MINIVFATLDCCMTTSTTKIAEDICTKLKLELCINENKVTTNLQDKHLGRLVTCGILTLEVVLTPCICYCIMMINTTSICLNILKTLRMTELMMHMYDICSLFMRNLASSLTGCIWEHASSHSQQQLEDFCKVILIFIFMHNSWADDLILAILICDGY